jgi:hypothetical protein
MDGISPIWSLVSRIRELENSQPSPSIADVAGNPNVPGPDMPDASEFTAGTKWRLSATPCAPMPIRLLP